ncbi:caspase family protein [uncultured Shimia sp.]|uniref:caspase family protein n=1 Tax=uncultured Shimia sp. TaxID=573152 RepID=UPI00260BB605|nr:caspase family protein [uncultured Shimia sp.]
MRAVEVFLGAAVIWHVLTFTVLAADRVALLVGNGNFDNPALSLANPSNDVNDLEAALSALGFRVSVLRDGTRQRMLDELSQFTEAAKSADVALFFFAGHGVQYTGENYLIGREFSVANTRTLLSSSVTLTEIRRALERARPKTGLIFVDACRDAPFDIAEVEQSGLARTSGGAGLMFVYSTDPGNVAFDGSGRNSVFTAALLDHIETPNLDVRLLIGRVRQQVVMKTSGKQVPWVEEALLNELTFAQDGEVSRHNDPVAADMRRWQMVVQDGSFEAVQGYLAAYPNGTYADIARSILAFGDSSVSKGTSQTSLDIVGDNPDAAIAALKMLGFVPPDMSSEAFGDAELGAAFERYQSTATATGDVDFNTMIDDATRLSMMLASTTAQRMRTDLVALNGVERTLTIAEDALRDFEVIAAGSDEYLAELTQARRDVAAIKDARDTVLGRLDGSRQYYRSLLDQSVLFVPQDASLALLNLSGGTRGALNVNQRAMADTGQFLKHVHSSRISEVGSMSWLADFLPNQKE